MERMFNIDDQWLCTMAMTTAVMQATCLCFRHPVIAGASRRRVHDSATHGHVESKECIIHDPLPSCSRAPSTHCTSRIGAPNGSAPSKVLDCFAIPSFQGACNRSYPKASGAVLKRGRFGVFVSLSTQSAFPAQAPPFISMKKCRNRQVLVWLLKVCPLTTPYHVP